MRQRLKRYAILLVACTGVVALASVTVGWAPALMSSELAWARATGRFGLRVRAESGLVGAGSLLCATDGCLRTIAEAKGDSSRRLVRTIYEDLDASQQREFRKGVGELLRSAPDYTYGYVLAVDWTEEIPIEAATKAFAAQNLAAQQAAVVVFLRREDELSAGTRAGIVRRALQAALEEGKWANIVEVLGMVRRWQQWDAASGFAGQIRSRLLVQQAEGGLALAERILERLRARSTSAPATTTRPGT